MATRTKVVRFKGFRFNDQAEFEITDPRIKRMFCKYRKHLKDLKRRKVKIRIAGKCPKKNGKGDPPRLANAMCPCSP